MSVFNVISLFGGLAMFLYGMRLMGDSLKQGSSGALKNILEKLTTNPLMGLLLGVFVTAMIQSSTATIVITSGLVAAGVLTLKQSLGIIIGANIGTTVTGQIIRLLDIDSSKTAWLEAFKPSTLAPIALIIGIILIMFLKFKNSNIIGSVLMGFGILFSGLLNMTGAVNVLSENGTFDALFANLGNNPILGYLTGAGVAFVLQSSSATVGILQAFSTAGLMQWKAIYAVIVGIYLGDCVTTAIVCSIGAKAEQKRVGIVNILFNLSETVAVLLVVTLLHSFGVMDGLWERTVTPGIIANTNTIFNIGCAIIFFPMIGVYEKLSRKIVKDDPVAVNPYAEKLESLSKSFFSTPAIALGRAYDVLLTMFNAARTNIRKAFSMIAEFDEKTYLEVRDEEENIDVLRDAISNYLVDLSPYIKEDYQVRIMDQYYKVVIEFERLGDHAMNIAEMASDMRKKEVCFSTEALEELSVVDTLLERILEYSYLAFAKRNEAAARHIEPLEQVTDDIVNALRESHIDRLHEGECNVYAGTCFLNLLLDIERISDVCSNIGIATITRIYPELQNRAHDYISTLHAGNDEAFNTEYISMHDEFFSLLNNKEEA